MTSRLVLFALLLLPLLPAGPACASKVGKKDSFPEAPSIVQQAEALGRTDRDEALVVLEGYLKNGEDKALMPWVTMAAGEQRRLNGEFDAARDHFEALVRTWPEHATADAAKLGMALVAIQSRKDSGNTWATLELIAVEHVPDTMNADRFRLLALKAQRDGKDPAVIAQLADQARSFAAADPVTLAAAGAELVGLGAPVAADGADAAPPAAGDIAALARAQENLKRKDMKAAIAEANALLADYPTSPLAEHARWVIKRAEAGDPYKPLTIGVLLPLTGEYAPPGKQLRRHRCGAGSGAGSKSTGRPLSRPFQPSWRRASGICTTARSSSATTRRMISLDRSPPSPKRRIISNVCAWSRARRSAASGASKRFRVSAGSAWRS
jgi:TolA-binding protein